MQILWFSSCSHHGDTKYLLVTLPVWHGSYVVPRADVLRGVEVTRIERCILLSYTRCVGNTHSRGVRLSRNISEAPQHVADRSTRTSTVPQTSVCDLFSLCTLKGEKKKSLADTSSETTGEKTIFRLQS